MSNNEKMINLVNLFEQAINQEKTFEEVVEIVKEIIKLNNNHQVIVRNAILDILDEFKNYCQKKSFYLQYVEFRQTITINY